MLRKRFVYLLICACAAFVAAGSSNAGLTVGVTEDSPQGYDDGGAAMFAQVLNYNLHAIRMSVDWDPSAPTTIPNQAALARAIKPAVAQGLQVLLSIQPGHSTDITNTPNGYDLFAQYCVLVAKAFPQVTDLIIGNEPNKQLFNNPSWNGTQPVGAYNYEKELAAAYDALKAFNPNLDVIGVASSPRGSSPQAQGNIGIPPVIFIDGIGDAYKASARAKPIADNVAFHPYPNNNTDSPDVGYGWPNAGVPNLDRLQQAWWDAFNGTGQPLFQEDGLKIDKAAAPPPKWYLDELGWQTDTTNLPGYTGTENNPPVSESVQAQYHAAVVNRYKCDPRVAALLFFHWIDETDRHGFQSGAVHADNTLKPVADSVKNAIAGPCSGPQTTWKHTTTVDGATTKNWAPKSGYLFLVYANEAATFTATATPKSKVGKAAKSAKSASALKPITVKGNIVAYLGTGVKFPGLSSAKKYSYSVKIVAAYNPQRMTILTKK